jgi:hypothetical protein
MINAPVAKTTPITGLTTHWRSTTRKQFEIAVPASSGSAICLPTSGAT